MASYFNRSGESFSNGGNEIEVIAGIAAGAVDNVNNHADANRDAVIGANAEGVRTVREDIKGLGDKVDANGETVLKSWFWPVMAVVFAVIAFVVYYFTKNIEYIATLDANKNPEMAYNYTRWVIIFGVPTIVALLMSYIPECREPKSRH